MRNALHARLVVAAAVALVVALMGLLLLVRLTAPSPAKAVVRVHSGAHVASGFYVDGPDDHRYVVTTREVVDRGETLLVEPGAEAADVVGYDARAGLAVLRLPPADPAVSRLALAPAAAQIGADVRVFSWQNRDDEATVVGATLDKLQGAMENARLGLSADAKAATHGGPVVDGDGDVVGVVLADGSAAEASAVAMLLGRLVPAEEAPSAHAIADLLQHLQQNVLAAKPVDLDSDQLVATSERHLLVRLLQEVRRRDRDTQLPANGGLSPRAALAVWEAKMSPMGFESLRSEVVEKMLARCDQALSLLTNEPAERGRATDDCVHAGEAPLAWDLLAATLHWSGRPRSFSVGRIESTDERGVFRAVVSAPSLERPVDVWITTDRGALRLMLFDADQRVYAQPTTDPQSLLGEWELLAAPVPNSPVKGVERRTVEHLRITATGTSVEAALESTHSYHGEDAARFRCNEKQTVEVGARQALVGTLAPASVLLPSSAAVATGRDAEPCAKWSGERVAAALVVQIAPDGNLVVMRTDRSGERERLVFKRAR